MKVSDRPGLRQYGFTKNDQSYDGAYPYISPDSSVYNHAYPSTVASQPMTTRSQALDDQVAQQKDDEITQLRQLIQARENQLVQLRKSVSMGALPRPEPIANIKPMSPAKLYEIRRQNLNEDFRRNLDLHIQVKDQEQEASKSRKAKQFSKRMAYIKQLEQEERARQDEKARSQTAYRQFLDMQEDVRRRGTDGTNRADKPSAVSDNIDAYMYGPNGLPLQYGSGVHYTQKHEKFVQHDPITGTIQDTAVLRHFPYELNRHSDYELGARYAPQFYPDQSYTKKNPKPAQKLTLADQYQPVNQTRYMKEFNENRQMARFR